MIFKLSYFADIGIALQGQSSQQNIVIVLYMVIHFDENNWLGVYFFQENITNVKYY